MYSSLEAAGNPSVILHRIVGSRAYGTANENSDTDIRGKFLGESEVFDELFFVRIAGNSFEIESWKGN